MPELRGDGGDRPDDKPERPQSQVERTNELTAIADAKALDRRHRVYDPLEHIRPGDRIDETPSEPGDRRDVDRPVASTPVVDVRPQLRGLMASIRSRISERYETAEEPETGTPDAPRAPGDVPSTRDLLPKMSDAEHLAEAGEGDKDEEGDRFPDTSSEDDPDAPAAYDYELADRAPDWAGGKTTGLLAGPDGQAAWEQPQLSGYKGPSAELPTPRRGMNNNILSHVEAHAAATMRLEGLQDATLYINRVPCPGIRGCDSMLPRMLPGDAKLTVYGPEEFCRVYRGLPEETER